MDRAAIAAVYDFQKIFETALKAVFVAQELKAFTSLWVPRSGDDTADAASAAAGYELLDFQKDRPRAEIFFTPGAGQGRFRELNVNGIPTAVECAWKGQYMVNAVTGADMRVHSDFVMMLRYLLQTMGSRINGVAPMTLHKIQPFWRDGGTTPVTKPEEGIFQTGMLYNIDFSIQDNAWDTIAT